jgi:hypothetical protein
MSEPTRPLRQPTVAPDGTLVAHSVATPRALTTRGLVTVGSRKVIPVIFVPGIMGSNLRASGNPAPPKETDIKPGEPVWHAPNGTASAMGAVGKWTNREPALRQKILRAKTCEVDPNGELAVPDSTPVRMKRAAWPTCPRRRCASAAGVKSMPAAMPNC